MNVVDPKQAHRVVHEIRGYDTDRIIRVIIHTPAQWHRCHVCTGKVPA